MKTCPTRKRERTVPKRQAYWWQSLALLWKEVFLLGGGSTLKRHKKNKRSLMFQLHVYLLAAAMSQKKARDGKAMIIGNGFNSKIAED